MILGQVLDLYYGVIKDKKIEEFDGKVFEFNPIDDESELKSDSFKDFLLKVGNYKLRLKVKLI